MSAAGTGSQTNAGDAADDVEVEPEASAEDLLDAGVQLTFPASDPVAVQDAYLKRLRRR